jgi:hypothetical protein
MSCECHRIGGRFIAEDPDCYEHGVAAQERARVRERLIERLERAMECGDDLYDAASDALDYLRSSE